MFASCSHYTGLRPENCYLLALVMIDQSWQLFLPATVNKSLNLKISNYLMLMPKKSLIPLAFTNAFKKTDEAITILAGDVGGTKTNMALYRVTTNGVQLLREGRYASQQYTSLTDIIVQFTGNEWPNRICVAVAGPVTEGKVQLTNLSWQLDSKAMSAALKIPVAFINDLEANSYGLGRFTKQ